MGIYMMNLAGVVNTYKTDYEINDIVAFKSIKNNDILIGKIEGYYVSTYDEEFLFHIIALDGTKYEYEFAITEKDIVGKLNNSIVNKIKRLSL